MGIQVQLSFFPSEWKFCCFSHLVLLPGITVMEEDMTTLCQGIIWVLFFCWSLWRKMSFFMQSSDSLCAIVPMEGKLCRHTNPWQNTAANLSWAAQLSWRSGEVNLKVTLSEESLENTTETVMFSCRIFGRSLPAAFADFPSVSYW